MTKTGKNPAASATSKASAASTKPAAGPSISTVSAREVTVLLLIMAALAGGAICLALFG